MKRFALIAVFALLCALALHADDKAAANLHLVVVKADNGKPVRNAAVVLHPVNKDGKQSHGGLELKTDPDGKASYAGVPYGKLRVQVLMRGFQTYGEDFEINQPTQEITIKLQRPKQQYSIYEDKPDQKKPDEKPK
jgi:hypothetical protein